MPEGLVNMKLSKKEVKESEPDSTAVDRPRFPFGLSLHLDQEALDKLGIDEMPAVGLEESMVAFVRVTSVSDNQHEGDSKRSRSVGLQITAMRFGEGPSGKKKSASSVLYGD